MRITKGRLKEIIKEELSRVNEGDLELWSDDGEGLETDPASTEGLTSSWAKEIEKWIASQWSADSDFKSVRAERPAIVAALNRVAKKMASESEPESYKISHPDDL